MLEVVEHGPDFCQHAISRYSFQLYVTTRRQAGEVILNLPIDALTLAQKERRKTSIHAITPMCLANEVKNGKTLFVWCMTQSTAKLLQKDSEALCWSQEEH